MKHIGRLAPQLYMSYRYNAHDLCYCKVYNVYVWCNCDPVISMSHEMTLDYSFVIPYSLYGNNIDGAGAQALVERLPHCTNPQNLK